MDSMIDQKVYSHPQLPPPQQMHPNLMNQRPPNHQMMPHPPHPHAQYQQQQQQQQQQPQQPLPAQLQHQQAQHSVRQPMIRMQNSMPMQSMHQPSGPVDIKPNIHNSMPSNVSFNNSNNSNNNNNNNGGNNNNDAISSAAAAANSHVFANGSHGSSNHPINQWPKQEQPHCSGCKKPIYERHLLQALDQLWHEDCLKCNACHARLGEMGRSLYFKADLLLCKTDYFRMFGQPGTCSACSQRISPFEMVMKAKSNNYHINCFACHRCQHRFCVGDRFFLVENRILCENDCENRSAVSPQNVNMRGTRAPSTNQTQSKQKATNARANH